MDWVWIGSNVDYIRQSRRNFPRVIFKLTASTEKAHLSILDLGQVIGCEDQTPVSWEVERERFLRKLGAI